MKKVLLIDTNVSSFPVYQSLVDKGYDVYVVSSKSTDCLAKYNPVKYINCNYSNTALLNLIIADHKFDFIVPGGNDVSYLSAAQVNTNNKYKGIDTVAVSETINNKLKFRNFALSHNINVPRIFTKNELDNLNKFVPLIVKPVDAFSGRGVTVIKDFSPQALNFAVENAKNFSNSKSCVIEEYIEGQLYSHSAFISNQKIIKDFIVIEHGTANQFTVDTSYVVHDFPKQILTQIRKNIETLSKSLNLVDGLVHTQFIKTKNSFKIIEVTRRCPGDLYSLLIEKSTGFKYAEYYTRPFVNEKFDKKLPKTVKNKIIRHTLSVNTATPFIGVKYIQPINIDLFVPLISTGDELKASPFGRIGIIFIKCKSKNELKNTYIKTLNRKLYVV